MSVGTNEPIDFEATMNSFEYPRFSSAFKEWIKAGNTGTKEDFFFNVWVAGSSTGSTGSTVLSFGSDVINLSKLPILNTNVKSLEHKISHEIESTPTKKKNFYQQIQDLSDSQSELSSQSLGSNEDVLDLDQKSKSKSKSFYKKIQGLSDSQDSNPSHVQINFSIGNTNQKKSTQQSETQVILNTFNEVSGIIAQRAQNVIKGCMISLASEYLTPSKDNAIRINKDLVSQMESCAYCLSLSKQGQEVIPFTSVSYPGLNNEKINQALLVEGDSEKFKKIAGSFLFIAKDFKNSGEKEYQIKRKLKCHEGNDIDAMIEGPFGLTTDFKSSVINWVKENIKIMKKEKSEINDMKIEERVGNSFSEYTTHVQLLRDGRVLLAELTILYTTLKQNNSNLGPIQAQAIRERINNLISSQESYYTSGSGDNVNGLLTKVKPQEVIKYLQKEAESVSKGVVDVQGPEKYLPSANQKSQSYIDYWKKNSNKQPLVLYGASLICLRLLEQALNSTGSFYSKKARFFTLLKKFSE